MRRKKIAVFTTVLGLFIGGSALAAGPVQAAPECRGATGIIRCTPDRIRCILNESLPPQNCL